MKTRDGYEEGWSRVDSYLFALSANKATRQAFSDSHIIDLIKKCMF